jgi:hypothetical protein
MRHGDAIAVIQFAVDQRQQGRSSWLAVMRRKAVAATTGESARATP